MDKFLETDRGVFTQFFTDGKIFHLQYFQACRNRNKCVSATGNDIMSNTSSASVAKEIKVQKYFTNLCWKSLAFPLLMMINNVHPLDVEEGILRSSQNTSLPFERLNYSCIKPNRNKELNKAGVWWSVRPSRIFSCPVDMAGVCPPTQRSQMPTGIHVHSHGLNIMARCVSDWRWCLGLYCKLKAVDVHCDQSSAFPLWMSPNWMSLNPSDTQYCLWGDVQAPKKIRSSGMSVIWISCDWL